MRPIGFSTGALALGDFRKALGLLDGAGTKVIELSALRDHELGPLMAALDNLDLAPFHYVSIHVPSKFKSLTEAEVAAQLRPCVERRFQVVIHPDTIQDPSQWSTFGEFLCIENMDKRKHTGRTADELAPVFAQFPKATFCLDIAHARQIDPTMIEARLMLRRFGDRLRQVHISEVDASGHHDRLSLATILTSQSLANLIDESIPVIIESMVPPDAIQREIRAVGRALTAPTKAAVEAEQADWGELA